MKPKYDVMVLTAPLPRVDFDNCGMIAKRHGFHQGYNGDCEIRKAGNNLETLITETEALTADLRAAKIKVTRIKIVETILDVEAE